MVARRTRPRKVLAFPAGGPEVPSSRLRIYCYRNRFRQEGVGFAVYEEGRRGFWRFLRNLYRFLTADVLLVQKRLLRRRRVWLCRLLGKRIAFDMDEADFIDPGSGREDAAALRGLRRFLRHCDLLVLCSPLLELRLARPGQRVLHLPTVPLQTPPTKPHQARGLPRLGWMGSRGQLPYLEALDGVLCGLQARYPFELVVVAAPGPTAGATAQDGAPPTAAPGPDLRTRHRLIPWDTKIDGALSEHFDVGLLPLPDNDRTRTSCGYPIVRYQSFGLPTVATPTDVHAGMIEHGITGLLAKDEREWHDCLELLLQNPALVGLMSARILEQYPQRFSIAHNFQRLFQTLCEIVAAGSGADRGRR